MPKLTPQQCEEIKVLRTPIPHGRKGLRPPMTIKAIAARYGVGINTVKRALLPTPPPNELKPRARQRTEQDQLKSRQYTLWRSYGMTLEDYDAMSAAQGGRCAICGITAEESSAGKSKVRRYLDIDHCHATGAVRALLCNRCNTALGRFDDDPVLLMKAIAYLQKYSE